MAEPGSLHALFRPTSIAVVGASPDNGRVGGRTLEILRSFGFGGSVVAVSPRHQEIDGLPCYPTIGDVPEPVQLAVLCVGSDRVVEAVRACADAGVEVVVIYAGGFSGDDEAEGRRRDLERLRDDTGIRILGPNTIGTRGVVQDGVFATFSHDVESGITPGSVAIVAQSGGLGVYFGSAYLRKRGTGTRYLVDTGNELDITAADVVEYVATDDEVSCIGLILEASRDGRRLIDAVRSVTASGKPVVLLKTGRSAASTVSIATHTGAMAGSARLFEVALRDAGAIVVQDEVDFVDALSLLDRGVRPAGRSLGVVSPSGGYAIVTVDAAAAYGMDLPDPDVPPTDEEADVLASGALANPFDYTSHGAVTPVTLKYAMQWMAKQDVDVIVFWQAYSLHLDWRRRILLDAIDNLRTHTDKPIVGCGLAPPGLLDELAERGVFWFEEPTRLVRALSLVSPAESPLVGDVRDTPATGTATVDVVTGPQAREALDFVDHVASSVVASAEEASSSARLGRIVLKVESPRYPHKAEHGLVAGPFDEHTAAAAYERIRAARERLGIDEPVVAQSFEVGVELVMGSFTDPVFGAAVMVGLGGIHVEIFRDVQLAVAPVDEVKANRMIESLRSAALLKGARGAEPADIPEAARVLAALSRCAADNENRWEAVDLNPVIVRGLGKGVVAVDAVIATRKDARRHV